MDKRVTPPKRVTSPTWGPPPPCKQALGFGIQVHDGVVGMDVGHEANDSGSKHPNSIRLPFLLFF